ncbi:MAG: hypothetical protein Q8O51_02590 [bacterium]|nr:hypothetical protein [bacterium]
MKKFLIIIPLLFLSACTFGQKVANTASEVKTDTGTIVNKATGVTDIAIKQAAEIKFATARAKEFYNAFKVQGEEIANGPCLSENLTSGWVADLVHNPRLVVDDEPANQCKNYLNGTAKHFVELDLEGNFVRAQ